MPFLQELKKVSYSHMGRPHTTAGKPAHRYGINYCGVLLASSVFSEND